MVSSERGGVLRYRGIIEAPIWFGPEDRPVFGWVLGPEDGRARGGVILCAPLAEDGNKAHRTMRECAARLAQAGYLAIRFDYDGTGDSAGGGDDPHRRDAWIASVRAAAAEVRRRGTTEVSIIGMRMGATIAHAAVAEGDLGVTRLVLWDPCVSGTAYLREQQLLQAAWPAKPLEVAEGWVETPSYLFSPRAADQVRTFSLTGGPTIPPTTEVTVLVREDRPASKRLRTAFPPERTQWLLVGEQGPLLDVSTADAAVPENDLQTVVEIFATDGRARDELIDLEPRPIASWDDRGQGVIESAGFIGHDHRLFTITTEPRTTPIVGPTVMFINVSFERHIGLGRMWTELARTLAAHGMRVVRLDHSGVGDSGLHPGQQPDTFYDVAWIADIPEALAPLGDVVAVGVCSSAVSALQAALGGAVNRVIAISVGLSSTELRVSRRWTALSHRPRWLRRLAERSHRTAVILENIGYVLAPGRHPAAVLRRLVGRGVSVTMLNGPEDAWRLWRNRAWNLLWGGALRRSALLRDEVLPQVDHSLRSGAARTAVGARLTQLLAGDDSADGAPAAGTEHVVQTSPAR